MRVLFIGLGGIGQRHLRNLKEILGSSVEVHAYRVRGLSRTLTDQLDVESGADLEKKYEITVHHELDSALASSPAVAFVCNPSNLHIPAAMAAAEAGCHLFIEKPLSHNLGGAESLIRALDSRGNVGLVGYQLRFHPCLEMLQEQVSSGLIGRPLSALVEVGEYLPNWHRYEDYRQMYASRADLGGGVILSQIHELDYLHQLFGMPRRVHCLGGHLSSLEIDVEDVASSLLDYEIDGKKMPVHLHQDYVQRPPQRGCTVIGDEGKICMSLSRLSFERYDTQGKLADRQSFEGFPRNELFMKEMRHFLDCIEGRSSPRTSLKDGMQSLRIALALKQSLETGRIVELEDIHG
jgi:predicted dehydrogenase